MQIVIEFIILSKEAIASLRQGFCLIFIVDKLKNFTANNLFKLLELVMY